jgi:hypothetical protein
MCETLRVLAEVKQIGQRVLDNSNKCKRNFFQFLIMIYCNLFFSGLPPNAEHL